MAEDYIDYGRLIDDSMRGIVRKALRLAEQHGLNDEHHFFITFQTQYPDVMISDRLLEKYPEEMTIIIQHQFWELETEEKSFSIVLSFDNIHESLVIPFEALTSFADPSVKFGLQFKKTSFNAPEKEKKEGKAKKAPAKGKSEKKSKEASGGQNNIVSLDNFRKK